MQQLSMETHQRGIKGLSREIQNGTNMVQWHKKTPNIEENFLPAKPTLFRMLALEPNSNQNFCKLRPLSHVFQATCSHVSDSNIMTGTFRSISRGIKNSKIVRHA